MENVRFRSHPTPSNDVVERLERALALAKRGYIQTVAIIAISPVHKAEAILAGDLAPIRANALLGGLTQAQAQVLKQL